MAGHGARPRRGTRQKSPRPSGPGDSSGRTAGCRGRSRNRAPPPGPADSTPPPPAGAPASAARYQGYSTSAAAPEAAARRRGDAPRPPPAARSGRAARPASRALPDRPGQFQRTAQQFLGPLQLSLGDHAKRHAAQQDRVRRPKQRFREHLLGLGVTPEVAQHIAEIAERRVSAGSMAKARRYTASASSSRPAVRSTTPRSDNIPAVGRAATARLSAAMAMSNLPRP